MDLDVPAADAVRTEVGVRHALAVAEGLVGRLVAEAAERTHIGPAVRAFSVVDGLEPDEGPSRDGGIAAHLHAAAPLGAVVGQGRHLGCADEHRSVVDTQAGHRPAEIESLSVVRLLVGVPPIHPAVGIPLGVERYTYEQSYRSEEHTSELQSPCNLVCRLLLEKKKQ